MKKILLAFDETNFSEGAFDFARRLNELSPVLLTAVFLPQAQIANAWSYAAGGSVSVPLLEGDDADKIEKNIARFKELCQSHRIDYRVHKDYFDLAIPALKKESRFADLVILGSEAFYSGFSKQDQQQYLEQVLHDLWCPVIVVPEKYSFPQSVTLTYDASTSSIFAIKQFAYLFPELCNCDVMLVHVTGDETKSLPEMQQMEELAGRHFPNLSMLNLQLNTKALFNTWLSERRSSILVCGSYGRSGISQLFKKSFITEIIDEHALPVFIAHR
ncbi:universal stress protein [Ferruginibacter sp. HRS2-29]|uniref:universal stress protein n=1 Tax=Ferruginibacter sp. HRS2-29 TaxID=2487334 RepID=UPI0020CE812F|nr:universal stress protein [Ferruginibacter sp. HRS2-29]MCP9753153.1 hypothetical protein [Ferruginibacter sp. HRS2-29]